MKDASRRHAELSRAFDRLRSASQQTEEVAQQLRRNEVRVADCLERLQRAERAMTYRTRAAALGQLFAGVCRDFNEQLEFLLASPDSAKAAARMADAGRDLKRRMSLYVKLSAQRPFHLSAFPLHEVLEETVLATEPRWKSQALTNGVVFRIAVNCPPTLCVRMDRVDLMEILVHLMDNAVEAMPMGGTILLEAAASERDTVLLVVRDPGSGMSDETLHASCEPFFSTRADAAGMGLAVVTALARRNSVRFGLSSARGQGTTAMIEMPVAVAATSSASPSLPLDEPPLRPLLILSVDDSPLTTDMIRELLEGDGHIVDACNVPGQVIELLTRRSYDVVLIDRAMPGMGGFELARAIKKDHAALPVVMLTGYAELMRQNGESVREIDALVGKPFTRQELVAALAVVTNARATRNA
jgi:CheY-like chemotaxis protein